MEKAIFITREIDGSFSATPCNDYRDLDIEKIKRVVWQDYFENDIITEIKKTDDPSVREGLEKALELYNKNKNILPAMFINNNELDTMTSAMISKKQIITREEE